MWKSRILGTLGLLLLAAALTTILYREEFRRAWILRADFVEAAPGIRLRAALSEEERARILETLALGRERAAAWMGGLTHPAEVVVVDDPDLRRSLAITNPYVWNPAEAEGLELYVGPKGLSVDLIAHGHMHAELKARLGMEAWHRIPSWLDEGLCTQVDWRPFLDPAALGESGLDDLTRYATHEAFSGDGGEDALVVAKREVTRWLALAGGPAVVPSLLAAVAKGESFATAYARLEQSGQQAEEDLAERVRAHFEALRIEQGFPGLQFGWAWANGRPGGSIAVGVRERGGSEALLRDDRMLWGSVGKTFVAAVVLQLVAEGKLKLDDRLAEYIGAMEGFARLPNAETVTLRQLFTHRSGIPDHVRKSELWEVLRNDPDKVWPTEELISWALDDAPLSAPGTQYDYADTNFVLLGAVVEKLTGAGLFDAVRTRLVEPYHLRNTAPSDRRRLPALVQGYPALLASEWGLPEHTLQDGQFFMNPQFEHGGGGMYGTSADLARWTMLLHAGPVLDAAMRAERLHGVPLAEGSLEQYGLGVQIWPSTQGVAAGHGGWYPGYRTETAWFEDLGLAAAVMLNTDAPQQTRSLRRLLVDGVALLAPQPADSR